MIPDEIIKEILTPVLRVPDDTFRSVQEISPFSTYSESTSAVLVVCKSWLRVATPLLYHVVVLRSKAQARALSRTLHANKLLGTFIKKFRVEGGYGSAIYDIIRLSPNIKELCLELRLWSSDNIKGHILGLPEMDPTCLIVRDTTYGPVNKITAELFSALCACIGKSWKSLEMIHLPYDLDSFKTSDIRAALAMASRVKTVVLQPPQLSEYSSTSIERFAEISSLKSIRIKIEPNGHFEDWASKQSRRCELALQESKYKELFCFEHPESLEEPNQREDSPTCFNESFVALQSATEDVKYTIWSNIVYFCIISDQESAQRRLGPCLRLAYLGIREDCRAYITSKKHIKKTSQMNIVLVSKLFHKMALIHYYRDFSARRFQDVGRLLQYLKANPFLGSQLQSLHFNFEPDMYFSWNVQEVLVHATALVHLSSSVPHLSFLPSVDPTIPLPWQSLLTLSNLSGSTLQSLTGFQITDCLTASPEPLQAFTALRTLEWNSDLYLDYKSEDVPVNALANLEWLIYSSANDGFLRALKAMKLPSLRCMSFPFQKRMAGAEIFLRKHGKKLKKLHIGDSTGIWKYCSSLSIIYLYQQQFDVAFVQHKTLEEIVLTASAGFREGRVRKMFSVLGEVNFRALYPALKEIRVYACRWPTNERECEKGPRANWVKWSARLLSLGIKLVDEHGKSWKPRLK